jgi:hypothetical protein
MAAPWEKFSSTQSSEDVGPWSKFSRAQPTQAEVPTPANLATDQRRPRQPVEPKGFATRAKEAVGQVFPMARVARAPTRAETAEFLGPAISAATTTGGGLVGTPLGPAGTVAGAGLGYGIGEEIIRRIRGDQPTAPKQTMRDIITGSAFEAGGRGVIGPLAERLVAGTGRVAGGIMDLPNTSRQRAATIARESVGQDNITAARKVLRDVISEDVTAAQALARTDPATGRSVINLPVAQALLQRASQRDPTFFQKIFDRQDAERLRQLAIVAGGQNQTAAREAQQEMQRLLNERYIPVLQTELNAANIAGQVGPRLETQAAQMGRGAEQKVEDVRRFTAAGERASATQEVPVPGMPRVSTQITYRGDLAQRADEVAAQAAEGSLAFGEARRFAEAALQSLEAHGLKPLKSDDLIRNLQGKLSDPKLAGNRDIQTSVNQVIRDIQEWTNNNGVIDAWALDSIRKNSVNAVIRQLYPAATRESQKELASSVLSSIKPVIVDAVEEAGGKGYGKYLRDYASGKQFIAQTELGAEALRLYQTNPEDFIRLVELNRPDLVEKIIGPGNFNLAKEMSRDLQMRLVKAGQEVKRDKQIQEQASKGAEALVDILKENLPSFRIPNFLNVYITTANNNALEVLEGKVGKETLRILTESAKDAKSFDELLSVLPATERVRVLNIMTDPATWAPIRPAAGGIVAGSVVAERPPPVQTNKLGGVTNMNPRLGGF